ncbi:MAG: hypothetical protein ACI9Y8_001168 [Candidatus Omnitrophota bacterium]|jgi:hypothetical protein
MTNPKLAEALKKLNAEIDKLEPADQESREKLETLVNDINNKLHGHSDQEQDNGLASQIKESALCFEARHPVISETLGEIKLALYGIGL